MNDEILRKRLNELSERAYERGYSTFTEFLNIDEISILKALKLSAAPVLFGGYENAERCVAGFGSEICEQDFPIVCIRIEPLLQKFADKLNHRDFLGALMNLGINRNTIGDILIKDNEGYVFCLESISEYIIENLKRIRHTSVCCEITQNKPQFLSEKPEQEEIIVSSLRADAVIAAAFKLSRNETTSYFNQEKVFINSRVMKKEAVLLRDNDIISVRGKGKFIFEGSLRDTKKSRKVISVRIYK